MTVIFLLKRCNGYIGIIYEYEVVGEVWQGNGCMLESEISSLGLSTGWGQSVVFLGKLNSRGATLLVDV